MSERDSQEKPQRHVPEVGSIGWVDLTVAEAEDARDFYRAVVGWKSEPVSMGDYSDFNLVGPVGGEARAGICHARGSNSGLPPVWMIYIVVADLVQSLAACRARGGEVVREPRDMGGAGRYAFIRDPNGAACALFQSAE